MQSSSTKSIKEILACLFLFQNLVSVAAFRQQQHQQPQANWPPGGWPPPSPPGPPPDGSTPTLEPQPHYSPESYKDHWHPDVYRQFATRYEPKPVDHAYLLHPENRPSYEKFIADHPRHPTYPNSVDRSAESLVMLVFALVGLSLIFLTVIVIDRLQARHISMKNITFGALSVVFGPWLLLWTWVLLVIVSNAEEPTRGIDVFHWACPLMLVYLGAFLFVHTINVIIQAYAEWHSLFAKVEGRMGQMLQAIDKAEANHPKWVHPVRVTFFALDVLIALLGMWLVFFSGPHRDFCQPMLWWTSAFIAAVTGAAFLALAAVYGCWKCVGALAVKSSGRDGLAFFHALYYGAGSDDAQPSFIPASEPLVETRPVLPQSEAKPVSPRPTLQHASTQPTFAPTAPPQLQHARTTGLSASQMQSIGRI